MIAERMRADGALIAGKTVELKASGSVRNDGILDSSRDTTIDADTLINTGALRAGERLGIATRGDILNTGALGGQRVTVRAGGSVVNAPQLDGLAASGGRIAAGVEGVGIVAAGDVVNQGVIRSAGWNGAVSAGFAEATGPYIKAHSGGTWGEAGGAAASGAASSWLGGGDPEEGALRGLSGYLFNEQLHPDAARYLTKQAEAHAREQCGYDPSQGQVDQARDSLIRTAYRMGDALYDRIASIQGTPRDEAAVNYIATHPLGGIVDGEPVSYFSPDDVRRNDPSVNGYALYNDKPALAWVQQATGLTNEQMYYNLAATDYARHPRWLNQYADAVVKTSDSSIYNTVGGTIFTGATGGLGAVSAPWVVGATAGTRLGSVAEYLLVTRTGAGVTNAAVNAAAQGVQADEKNPFRPVNVAFSFVTGFAGVNAGFVQNVAVNTAVGSANTLVNNWIYRSDENSIGGAATSGITGGMGYLASSWIAGRGKTAQVQRLGSVVRGNVLGAIATEAANWTASGSDNASHDEEKKR